MQPRKINFVEPKTMNFKDIADRLNMTITRLIIVAVKEYIQRRGIEV